MFPLHTLQSLGTVKVLPALWLGLVLALVSTGDYCCIFNNILCYPCTLKPPRDSLEFRLGNTAQTLPITIKRQRPNCWSLFNVAYGLWSIIKVKWVNSKIGLNWETGKWGSASWLHKHHHFSLLFDNIHSIFHKSMLRSTTNGLA